MERKIWGGIWVLALWSLLLNIETTNGANILALFPLATRSHNNVYSAITRELAQRGHHFTVVTSQPIESPPPNYHQIDVYKLIAHRMVFNVTNELGPIELLKNLKGFGTDICRIMTADKRVYEELVKPRDKRKFDLILLSNFFNECYYAFGHVYQAPIVLISPGSPMPSTYSAVGNVVLPSFFAQSLTGYSDRMSFKERVVNTLAVVGFTLLYKFYVQAQMEEEMRAVFGEDIPSISELEEHVSLAVMNSHFSLNQARPSVPCLIEVGGIHIKPPKDLPKDLKGFLDGAGKDGVIYFSLGSVLKSSQFPKETVEAFNTAFSQIKQKVLWKWEGASPFPGQAKNVRTEKWLPQQDVLAHPNVKLFITHGGLLSFQEATSRGVPLIGIPYYGDQEKNMKSVLDLQVGVKLNPNNLTASNILNAINEVLGEPSYSTKMKRLQSIFMDQKDQPLDTAIYWIEYVMRHKGAKHLKPAAFYLQWYQICMLDVLFVIVVIPIVAMFIIAIIVKKLLRKMCSSKETKKNSVKKTQ